MAGSIQKAMDLVVLSFPLCPFTHAKMRPSLSAMAVTATSLKSPTSLPLTATWVQLLPSEESFSRASFVPFPSSVD